MAMTDVITQFEITLVANTPVKILDGSTAQRTLSRAVRYLRPTNNDTAAPIYLDFQTSPGPTAYWKVLLPGQPLEYDDAEMEHNAAKKLYAMSPGTPKMSVVQAA